MEECLLYIVQALLHQGLRRNAFLFSIKGTEGIAPVSYTHLDVYKRQA